MADELLLKAERLKAEALKTIGNPDANAEELEQAERKMTEVEALFKRSNQMQQLLKMQAEGQAEARSQENVPGEALEEIVGFKSFGEFLHTIWKSGAQGVQDSRLRYFRDEVSSDTKALGEAVGADGGFLVPVEFDASLMAVRAEDAIIRPRATVIPMRRRQITMPVLDQTGTTEGVPHWFGGMQFYWTEESGLKEETQPKFRKVTLTANKLIGYTRSSDELLDDSAVSLEAFLNGPLGFAGGAVWMEEYNFLRGDGVGKPQGILTADATIAVPRQADGEVVYTDLVNMLSQFMPSGRGVWVISQSAMSSLLLLNGPTGNPSFLWGSAVTGAPNTLLGRPVIWSEKLPALGVKGDVMLVDASYYLVGDRQATTIESTKFDRWQYDQTSWRMVHRVDGRPWLSAPITYSDGSTQISPFVVLGDKDS